LQLDPPRYFIDCERRALAAVGQVVPASHQETLIPSEQQILSEVVHTKVARLPDTLKGKAIAEVWSRLHNKFRVAQQFPLVPHKRQWGSDGLEVLL
jgi:hypothetical protein